MDERWRERESYRDDGYRFGRDEERYRGGDGGSDRWREEERERGYGGAAREFAGERSARPGDYGNRTEYRWRGGDWGRESERGARGGWAESSGYGRELSGRDQARERWGSPSGRSWQDVGAGSSGEYEGYGADSRGGGGYGSGYGGSYGSSYGRGYGGQESTYGREERSGRSEYGAYGSSRYGRDPDYGRDSYGRDYGREDRGSYASSGSEWRHGGSNPSARSRAGQESGRYGYGGNPGEERGFWERTKDEVRSWMGDEDAERRRRMDEQRGHSGRGPRSYTRSDDRIREDVNDRLTDDWYVDASEIEVSVSGGEVTLSGTVDTRHAKRRAEDICESVSGVRHVQNNLRLRQSEQSTTGSGLGAQGGSLGSGSGSYAGGSTTGGGLSGTSTGAGLTGTSGTGSSASSSAGAGQAATGASTTGTGGTTGTGSGGARH